MSQVCNSSTSRTIPTGCTLRLVAGLWVEERNPTNSAFYCWVALRLTQPKNPHFEDEGALRLPQVVRFQASWITTRKKQL